MQWITGKEVDVVHFDNCRCALDFDKLEQASAVPVRGKQLINLLDC